VLRDLQTANNQLQSQHAEISHQKAELSAQALVLEDQNEDLVRHHAFQNKVLSILSHDLRTPFNSLKAMLDLVQDGRLSLAETTSVFGLLSKEMDTHSNMLQNLLEWAKAQLSGTRVSLEPVDLQLLVADTLEQASPESERKNITLVNMVPDATILLTDWERMNFVLRNLVMNAIKYTYAGGEVKVAVTGDAGGIRISVKDNGMGIAPRYLKHLFTPQRFSTLGTGKEKGTGLGLMLCQEFVESLHGKISVETESGKGSTFTIWLPTGPESHPQTQHKAAATEAGKF
jgi:signal transduction histidine kinase